MEIQNKEKANVNLTLVTFISLVILTLLLRSCGDDSVPNIQVATKEILEKQQELINEFYKKKLWETVQK